MKDNKLKKDDSVKVIGKLAVRFFSFPEGNQESKSMHSCQSFVVFSVSV